VVVNDQLDLAVVAVAKIVRGEKDVPARPAKYQELVNEFLTGLTEALEQSGAE